MAMIFFCSPSFASSSVKDSYLNRFNNIANRLESIAQSLKILGSELASSNPDMRYIRRTVKQVHRQQFLVNRNLNRLSRSPDYLVFIEQVNQEKRFNTFNEFRANSIANRRSFQNITRGDGFTSLQAIYETQLENQELLEELTMISKAAAFGDPNEAGVFGVVSRITGNCMPGLVKDSSCKLEKLATEIRIRELTHYSAGETVVYYNFAFESLFSVTSSSNGTFIMNLDPGEYSIFVVDGDKEYCNSFDMNGNACKLVIKDGMRTEYNFTIDNAFW
jgi:hypothetical protein